MPGTVRWATAIPIAMRSSTRSPFTPLAKPLAAARVALVTTAAPYRPELGNQGAGAPYNAAAKFYEVYSGDSAADHDLRVSHVAVDQAHLSDDQNCWFPLPALRRAAARGPDRRAHGALPRRAHQPQPAPHPGGRRARTRAGAAARTARTPRSSCPTVPCATSP